jgi:flagellar hook-basal body complex protein FliE
VIDAAIAAIVSGPEFRVDPGAGLATESVSPAAPDAGEGSFGNALTKAVERLETSAAESSAAQRSVVDGSATDLTSVVMAVERAGLEMQVATQFRNKAVEAYQEIFRLQV